MDYVGDNPAGDHRLETLAEVAQSSPFNFHRIFRALTAETVAEFGRRARLERAGYLMKARPKRACIRSRGRAVPGGSWARRG